MYPKLKDTFIRIQNFDDIATDRKAVLQPLVDYIQEGLNANRPINLNFICTHNSRRSHLAQIWAQTAAYHHQIPNIHCYSGGTEETALFPKLVETLKNQGFKISQIGGTLNPIYAIKSDENALPIIGFSKKYDSDFNPNSSFAAIMTCSDADQGCPFISGAQKRIPITYEDPKTSDNTAQQSDIYAERSLQIAQEMHYIFSKIEVHK